MSQQKKPLNWWQKLVRGKNPSASAGSFLLPNAADLPPSSVSAEVSQLRPSISQFPPLDSEQLSTDHMVNQYRNESVDVKANDVDSNAARSRLQQLKPTLKQQEQLRASALKSGKKTKNSKKWNFQIIKKTNISKLAWFFLPFLAITVLAIVVISKMNHSRIEEEFLSEKQRYANLGKSIQQNEATIPELVPLANRYSRWLNGGFLSSPNILEWDSALSKVQRHFGWSDMSWSFLSDEATIEKKNILTVTAMRIMLNQKNVGEIYNVQQLLSAYVSNDGPLIYVSSCQTIKNTIPTMSECILEWVTARPQDKDGNLLSELPRRNASGLTSAESGLIINSEFNKLDGASDTDKPRPTLALPINVSPISVTPAAAAAKNKTPTVSER